MIKLFPLLLLLAFSGCATPNEPDHAIDYRDISPMVTADDVLYKLVPLPSPPSSL